jgi:hypothetical protein
LSRPTVSLFAHQLNSWIFGGKVYDPYHEFFAFLNNDNEPCMDITKCPKEFLSETQSIQVFNAGCIMRTLPKEAVISGIFFKYFMGHLFQELSQFMEHFNQNIKQLCHQDFHKYQMDILLSCATQKILERFNHYLIHDLEFYNHLDLFRDIFLLGNNELIEEFLQMKYSLEKKGRQLCANGA